MADPCAFVDLTWADWPPHPHPHHLSPTGAFPSQCKHGAAHDLLFLLLYCIPFFFTFQKCWSGWETSEKTCWFWCTLNLVKRRFQHSYWSAVSASCSIKRADSYLTQFLLREKKNVFLVKSWKKICFAFNLCVCWFFSFLVWQTVLFYDSFVSVACLKIELKRGNTVWLICLVCKALMFLLLKK